MMILIKMILIVMMMILIMIMIVMIVFILVMISQNPGHCESDLFPFLGPTQLL